MSEVTHVDSLRVRLSDDAAGLQVEVSNAARHGKTAVDVGLANAIPGHKATAPLDPMHRHTYAHTHMRAHNSQLNAVTLGHSGDIYLSGGETLDAAQGLCNTKAVGRSATESGINSNIAKGLFTN